MRQKGDFYKTDAEAVLHWIKEKYGFGIGGLYSTWISHHYRMVLTVTKESFHKNPKYQWIKDEKFMEYLLNKDYNTFCIGYELLKQKGVIDAKDEDKTL